MLFISAELELFEVYEPHFCIIFYSLFKKKCDANKPAVASQHFENHRIIT